MKIHQEFQGCRLDFLECTDLKSHNYLNLSNNLVNSNKSEDAENRQGDEGHREQLHKQSVLREFLVRVLLLRNACHDEGACCGDRCETRNGSADDDDGDKF